jgi:hypothetical protein
MDNSTFGNWDAEIHSRDGQQTRMESAAKGELTPLSIDADTRSGIFSGKHGRYETTLTACQCRDFSVRRLPCKHIYRLAYELQVFDLNRTVVTSLSSIVSPGQSASEEIDFSPIEQFIDNQPYDSYLPMYFLLDCIHDMQFKFRNKAISYALDYISDKLNKP